MFKHKHTVRRAWKTARRRKGLSQPQVAARIGCTRSHYANMENGYRDAHNYVRKVRMVLT